MARALSNPVLVAQPQQGVDGRTILAKARAPSITDGRIGDFWIDTVSKKLYGPKNAGAWPDNGLIKGDEGWTPVFAAVVDGIRRVQQVVDWVGGQGTKPATGQYVGATGLVDNIADAVDMRGAEGPEMLISGLAAGIDNVSYETLLPNAEAGDDNKRNALKYLYSAGGEMKFKTVAAASAAAVPAGVSHVSILEIATLRVRVATEPSSGGKHRSADRFLPNGGGTDSANGGWWADDITVFTVYAATDQAEFRLADIASGPTADIPPAVQKVFAENRLSSPWVSQISDPGHLLKFTAKDGRMFAAETPVIDVRKAGVKPGASRVSNSNAMHDFLSTVLLSSEFRGGRVYFPAGQYQFQEQFTAGQNSQISSVYFQGDGQLTTYLDFNGITGDAIQFKGGAHFGASDLCISGAGRHGIAVNPDAAVGDFTADNGSQQGSFRRLRLQNCGQSGFYCKNTFLLELEGIWATSNRQGITLAGSHTTVKAARCYASDNTLSGWVRNGIASGTFDTCAADRNGDAGFIDSNLVGVVDIGCYGEENYTELFRLLTSNASATGLPAEYQNLYVTKIGGWSWKNSQFAEGAFANYASITTANGRDAHVTLINVNDNAVGANISLSIPSSDGATYLNRTNSKLTSINNFSGNVTHVGEETAGSKCKTVALASGQSIDFPADCSGVILGTTAAVDTVTIVLPATSSLLGLNNRIVEIYAHHNVTTLTIDGNGSTVSNSPTSLSAGQACSFVLDKAAARWIRRF